MDDDTAKLFARLQRQVTDIDARVAMRDAMGEDAAGLGPAGGSGGNLHWFHGAGGDVTDYDPDYNPDTGIITLKKTHYLYYWDVTTWREFSESVDKEFSGAGDYLYWELDISGTPTASMSRGADPMGNSTQTLRHRIVAEIDANDNLIPRRTDDVYIGMGG